MRKLTDTVVLLFLLIGPALVLTCVRPSEKVQEVPYSQEQLTPMETDLVQARMVYLP